jgi:hypothetical protein
MAPTFWPEAARLVAGNQVYVEVGVGEVGVDEGVGALPRGVRAHLVAVPAGEMDDFVFGEFGEFAADGFFRDIVERGDTLGADAGGVAACSGQAEKFSTKGCGRSHDGT